MIRSAFLRAVFAALIASLLVAQSSWTAEGAAASMPAFLKKKNTYTPLIFFTVPKGTMDECDGMEKVIQSLEKERGVRVQRLDIMRDRHARKLYEKLVAGNLRSPFPLLYHRESLQRVYGQADADLVRSWSKGRLLPDDNHADDMKEVTVLGGDEDAMLEDEELDMEELEMEMDQELTPVQRKGKEAMKRRMEEGRKKS